MVILKCKMCGGDLNVEPGSTVCECEYCGTKQTVPNTDDEKKLKLYERANRLRLRSEFDKAAGVYESLIEEYPEEAEAYWGNLLCKYGIEYVDDPATGDKIPTCHRSSFDCFMDDPDFELVMENSDSVSRKIYREQAKEIEEIRKGIIDVSGKEQPYDIFICYKESDDNGDRTLDSVLAQDIYEALSEKGYRVFFSRISLEDKLGAEYEPYIFAALNSAKVMLAIGTSYDYYNAVWVKNEWSRFLKLMAMNKHKHLIPCYKDIDAYDMPKEFAKLQAQDMGKVGANQDLIRGIDKIFGKYNVPNSSDSSQSIVQSIVGEGPNIAALTDRGYMSLEDGLFDEAINYFNRVLDINSKTPEAYFGLFMADIQARTQSDAKRIFTSVEHIPDRYWNRTKQFASASLRNELLSWEDEKAKNVIRYKDEIKATRYRIKTKLVDLDNEKHRIELEIPKLMKEYSPDKYEEDPEEKEKLNQLYNRLIEADRAVKKAEKDLDNQKFRRTKNLDMIQSEIILKRGEIKQLSVFKNKEKRDLQSQIDVLLERFESERKIDFDEKLDILRNKAESIKVEYYDLQKKHDEKKNTFLAKMKSELDDRIFALNQRLSDIDTMINRLNSQDSLLENSLDVKTLKETIEYLKVIE